MAATEVSVARPEGQQLNRSMVKLLSPNKCRGLSGGLDLLKHM